MSSSDDFARTSSSPWISSFGETVHPDSPRGGGGPGRFASPGPLGAERNPADFPHPQSPSGRNMLASDAERILLAANTKPMVMGNVKLNITVNKPKVSTFKVGGKTLADAKKALDAGTSGACTTQSRSRAALRSTGRATSSASPWC